MRYLLVTVSRDYHFLCGLSGFQNGRSFARCQEEEKLLCLRHEVSKREGVHGDRWELDDMQTLLILGCRQPKMPSDTTCALTWIPIPRPLYVWDKAETLPFFRWMRHLPETPLEM